MINQQLTIIRLKDAKGLHPLTIML